MTHNFSDDELNYLTPEDDKEEPGTEAVAFDPFADEDGDESQCRPLPTIHSRTGRR